MASDTKVYVRLLDEGTVVYRPVMAIHLGGKLYSLMAESDYDPEVERWEFVPGSVVRCEQRNLHDGQCLVAVELVEH